MKLLYMIQRERAAIAEQSKKIIQNDDELKPYLEKILELHEQLKQHKKQKDQE